MTILSQRTLAKNRTCENLFRLRLLPQHFTAMHAASRFLQRYKFRLPLTAIRMATIRGVGSQPIQAAPAVTAAIGASFEVALGHQDIFTVTCCWAQHIGLFWVWLIVVVVRLFVPPSSGTVHGRLQVTKTFEPLVPVVEWLSLTSSWQLPLLS